MPNRYVSNAENWPPHQVAQLTELWHAKTAAGAPLYSTREIGILMRMNKNRVIGKAHRLGLPARPTPIRPASNRRPRPTNPAIVVYRPPPPVLTPPDPEPRMPRRRRPCAWPIGEPGKPGFHFCGEQVVELGQSYCGSHMAIAFPKRFRS